MFLIISSSAKLEGGENFLNNKRRQGGINQIPFGMNQDTECKHEYMKRSPGKRLPLPGKW